MYRSALNLSPNSADYQFELALVYFSASKYERSLEEMEKAIQLDNSSGVFKLWKTRLLVQQKKFSQALDEINLGLKILPLDKDMLETKLQILQQLGYNKQVEDLQQRLKLFFSE